MVLKLYIKTILFFIAFCKVAQTIATRHGRSFDQQARHRIRRHRPKEPGPLPEAEETDHLRSDRAIDSRLRVQQRAQKTDQLIEF